MASFLKWSIFTTLLSVLAIQLPISTGIGVNFGRTADNLPSPQDVVGLYKKCGIEAMRLFEPSPDVLEALRGSNLQLSLGVRDGDVPILASSPDAATQWVNTNIVPYKNDVNFQWISVGNEMIPGANAASVPQAMQNIYNAITSIGLTDTKVTTVFFPPGLAVSNPPSAGIFNADITDVMKSIAAFLVQTGAPLMVNLYPYFAYKSFPNAISFEFATFSATDPGVIDGDFKYFSLLDAQIDAIYAALEKIDAGNVNLIIGETGWPTAGNEPITSVQNAQIYNQNLIQHLQSGGGTPRRPGQALNAFIFAMFNEDQKPSGNEEQHWGLFNPDMSAVYPLLSC